jgi:hypothetical protein
VHWCVRERGEAFDQPGSHRGVFGSGGCDVCQAVGGLPSAAQEGGGVVVEEVRLPSFRGHLM